MSDFTLNQLSAFLKGLKTRFEKLDCMLEQLEMLAYRYQRLSAIYKELAETLDHIDGVVCNIRQQFDQMAEVSREEVLVLSFRSRSVASSLTLGSLYSGRTELDIKVCTPCSIYKFLYNLLDQELSMSITFKRWPGGRVVMQRTANPCIPVRFRSWPPVPKKD